MNAEIGPTHIAAGVAVHQWVKPLPLALVEMTPQWGIEPGSLRTKLNTRHSHSQKMLFNVIFLDKRL